MHTSAPLPDSVDGDSESAGLDILDLVKHASKTILEGMKPGDRLALIKFSSDAEVSLSIGVFRLLIDRWSTI